MTNQGASSPDRPRMRRMRPESPRLPRPRATGPTKACCQLTLLPLLWCATFATAKGVSHLGGLPRDPQRGGVDHSCAEWRLTRVSGLLQARMRRRRALRLLRRARRARSPAAAKAAAIRAAAALAATATRTALTTLTATVTPMAPERRARHGAWGLCARRGRPDQSGAVMQGTYNGRAIATRLLNSP